MVQPLQNAFEAIGERHLEVAATLRAGLLAAFWSVAVPLARPGFLFGAILSLPYPCGSDSGVTGPESDTPMSDSAPLSSAGVTADG